MKGLETTMDKQRIEKLIETFNTGKASPAEIGELETLIEKSAVELSALSDLKVLQDRIFDAAVPEPTSRLDNQFLQLISSHKPEARINWKQMFSWPNLVPRFSLAAVTLIAGLAAGYYLRPATSADPQIDQLSQQVTDLKEMMMLTLLQKESATDRLKAVNLTQEMSAASEKVTGALLSTLNNDSNVNVRLAALDALKAYTNDSDVRQSLIQSIARQESPLVQIALAELMAALQEKSSVKEFEKILKDDKTPRDIKKRIEENIDVLI